MYDYLGPGRRLATTLLAPGIAAMIGVSVLAFRNTSGYFPYYTRKQWPFVFAIIGIAAAAPHAVFAIMYRRAFLPGKLFEVVALCLMGVAFCVGFATALIALDERLRR